VKKVYILLTACKTYLFALFDAATKLFREKWSNNSNAHMVSYLDYFEKEWVAQKVRFVAYVENCPTTNKGLESTNAVIEKREFSTQTYEPFFVFANVVGSCHCVVKRAAFGGTSLSQAVRHSAIHFDYTDAYHWLKDPLHITIQQDNVYYTRASENKSQSTNVELRFYKLAISQLSFNNLDQYCSIVNGTRRTILIREDFLQSKCSCFLFFF